jgi:hypothetical protein
VGRNKRDFYSEILYHGSPSAIPIGELVEPRIGDAHATTDLATARFHANSRFTVGRGVSNQPGVIHRVVPVENDDTLWAGRANGHVMSKKGFKVVGYEPNE